MRKLKLFLDAKAANTPPRGISKASRVIFSVLTLLLLSVGNVWAADVTYDFTGSGWSVSNGTLSNGTVSFTGAGSDKFQMNTGYFILGKQDAYITFPAYEKAVEKIVVTGRSGASGSTKMNIFVGDNAVSTETTGSTGTNTYAIASANQAAGTIYKLKVTSAHNAQITKIEVFYVGGGDEPGGDEPGGDEPGGDDPTPTSSEWIKVEPGDLATNDVVVIVENDSKAMSNDKGTSAAPAAVAVTVSEDKLSEAPADNIKWTVTVSDGSYVFATGNNHLYCTNTNNGVRVGTNANSAFTISEEGYLYNTATSRYVGVYNNSDWRCYTTINTNIQNQTFSFFKESDGTPQKEAAGLAYAEADQKKLVKLGETFTAPTLSNPNNLEGITYVSNNTDVAEVAANGAVTIKAVGFAEITASFAGNDDYKAGTAKYTIGVVAHAGTQADPYTVADAKAVIDALGGKAEVYAAGIVSTANLDQDNIDQHHNATYWISDDGTTANQLEAFRGRYLENEDITSVTDILVGDEVVIYGNLTKYNNTYEFADGNYLFSLDRNKAAAGLSYTVLEIEKNIGDVAFTNELTNPNNLTVTYSSSNASVASVDAASGLVTINAMGTAVITASFGGNASYLEGEAAYTLIVNDPSLTKVTFDASNENDKTSGDDEWTLTKGDITLSISEGRLNTAEYRLYKDKVLTLASSNGNIKRVELECTASGDTKYGPGSITAQEGYSYNGTIGVWVGDAASVELTAGNNQTRMSKINVYYIPDTRTAAGLAWDPADDIEITVGETFTAPTLLNPNSIDAAEITIESSNTSLATVTAGVVALVADATGEATITATFAGNDDYKPATVSYNITVNAVAPTPAETKNVVILAEYNSKFYAMTNSLASGALAAVEVEKDGEKIVVFAEADKAAIQWTMTDNTTTATFQDADDKYLAHTGTGTSLALQDAAEDWTWDSENGYYYAVANRTFFYNNSGVFKNYSTSNLPAEKTDYSGAPEIIEIAAEDIILSEKVDPQLAYAPAEVTLTVGGAFTQATLTYVEGFDGLAAVTYASNNEDVATVDENGVVSLVADAIGTATITATFAGNNNYLAGSASYVITVNEAGDDLSGTWRLANAVVAGQKIIIGSTKGADTYAMGKQNPNNRAAVASTIDGDILTPGAATKVFTLVDAGDGKFAIQASNGKYLTSATSGSSNNLLEADNYDLDNAKWTISIEEGVASIVAAAGSKTVMQYNSGNTLFSCYGSASQTDVKIYSTTSVVRTELTEGWYYTMCLDKAVTAVQGGTIWRVLSKAANDKDVILEEVEGTLDAGRPYIFYATANALQVVYAGPAVLAPVTEGNNGLIGSFTQELIDQSATNYIIYNNALYFVNSDNVYVGANRAYLDMTGVPAYSNEPQQGAPRRRVTMTVHGEQTTTGVDALNASETPVKVIIEGKLYIIRGEKMFNANGQLVK